MRVPQYLSKFRDVVAEKCPQLLDPSVITTISLDMKPLDNGANKASPNEVPSTLVESRNIGADFMHLCTFSGSKTFQYFRQKLLIPYLDFGLSIDLQILSLLYVDQDICLLHTLS